jgi:fibronectin type 3 domain-containing protein
LSWIASPSTVIGYNVYRATISGGPYTRLNSSLIPTTQYSDVNVQSGQTYYYVVTAMDSSNMESSYSNQSSATIPTP